MPTNWEYELHPLFGLLHDPPGSCPTCDAYTRHIAEIKSQNDTDFQQALENLHHLADRAYFEGLEAGKRHCIQDCKINNMGLESRQEALISRLRRERDEALRAKTDLILQLKLLEGLVRDKGVLLKTEPAENAFDAPSAPPPHHSPHSQPSRTSNSLSQSLPTFPLSGPSQLPRPSEANSPNERVLRELRELMSRAQSGNRCALSKIKALCNEAHQTPAESKTYAHRVVLSEWRNPEAHSTRLSRFGSKDRIDDGPHIVNPRIDDSVDIWFKYLTVYRSSWPRGVRQDHFGKPLWSDLSASRTFARLRPPPETPSNLRMEFLSSMLRLFTIPGCYEMVVRKEEFIISPRLSFRPYDAQNGLPITPDTVAKHFASCGVSLLSASNELEPWAQEYQRLGGKGIENAK